MIRKYHNHKLQTNLWHREEEPHNSHETPGRQTNQSNQLSFPNQGDCKTRKTQGNAQKHIEQYRIPQWEKPLATNQQQQNHRLRTDSSLSLLGLQCILLVPNLRLDSAVVEAKECLARMVAS